MGRPRPRLGAAPCLPPPGRACRARPRAANANKGNAVSTRVTQRLGPRTHAGADPGLVGPAGTDRPTARSARWAGL